MKKLKTNTQTKQRLVTLLILVLIMVILSCISNKYLTVNNLINIVRQESTLIIIACAATMLMISGGMDLSPAGVIALTSVVFAKLCVSGISIPLAALLSLLVGVAAGTFSGLLVVLANVPPMIATLGTQYICYGLAKLLTQAVPIANMPDSISFLGRGYIFGGVFPVCVLLMIIVYAIAQFVTSKTRVGRNLYAVGGSREAAFFSGINVKAYQFGTFLLGSVLATFGGLVLMSRLNSVAVTNGQNYEFDAVIGSIIGGVSLAGGKGRVIGTMFGCIFLNTLFNGFSQMGVDPFVQDVLKGVVLVLAVTLDVASNKKKS